MHIEVKQRNKELEHYKRKGLGVIVISNKW